MRAGISTEIEDPEQLLALVRESPEMIGSDLALAVSPRAARVHDGNGNRFRVAAIDYGMKRNIVRLLNAASCRVRVLPASATAEQVLEDDPDGIFLSNGPGDPAALAGADRHDREADPQAADLRDLPRAISSSAWRWAPGRSS